MRRCLTNRFAVTMILIFICFLQVKQDAQAMPPKTDTEMITESLCGHCHDERGQNRPVTVMQVRGQGFLTRYNPLTLSFSGLMYLYQRVISPQLPSACLYEHSCSSFSRQLILEYGLAKGLFTTADRLMRCNRVAATDIHPLSIGSQSGKVMETIDVYKIHPE
jgi:uncharacterized protein